MFKITDGKGFQITFDNGYSISVQFGPGNYCENRDLPYDAPKKLNIFQSKDAEIAVFNPDGEFVRLDEHDDVLGRLSSEEVLEWMIMTAKK